MNKLKERKKDAFNFLLQQKHLYAVQKKVWSVSVSSQLIYLWITFSYKYTLSPDSIIFLKSCSVIGLLTFLIKFMWLLSCCAHDLDNKEGHEDITMWNFFQHETEIFWIFRQQIVLSTTGNFNEELAESWWIYSCRTHQNHRWKQGGVPCSKNTCYTATHG